MKSVEVTIQLNGRMDTRPVAMLVQTASRFSSNIYIESENMRVNAKSIMGMMTLGLDSGCDVTVVADGEDEEEAVSRIAAYLTNSAA